MAEGHRRLGRRLDPHAFYLRIFVERLDSAGAAIAAHVVAAERRSHVDGLELIQKVPALTAAATRCTRPTSLVTLRPITPIAVTIFPLAAAQKTWLAKFTADISIDVD